MRKITDTAKKVKWVDRRHVGKSTCREYRCSIWGPAGMGTGTNGSREAAGPTRQDRLEPMHVNGKRVSQLARIDIMMFGASDAAQATNMRLYRQQYSGGSYGAAEFLSAPRNRRLHQQRHESAPAECWAPVVRTMDCTVYWARWRKEREGKFQRPRNVFELRKFGWFGGAPPSEPSLACHRSQNPQPNGSMSS